jgi:hypothetical protein
MASTRNINTPGDYELEQTAINRQFDSLTYTYAANGRPHLNYLAGNGLLMGSMPSRQLSDNYCDIDSYLKGIGSTNLVKPLAPVIPQLLSLKSLNIIETPVLQIPKPLVVEPNQRPQWS